MHDGEPNLEERAILTPDQRLRVFINSTLTELARSARRTRTAPPDTPGLAARILRAHAASRTLASLVRFTSTRN